MDIVPAVAAAQDYLGSHPWATFALGSAAGYAASNVPQMTSMAFKVAMRFPPFKAAILANPKRAKEVIDLIEKELDREIDEAAGIKGDSPAPPAP